MVPTKNAVAIANPPPLGVGAACELRRFGMSSKLVFRAYRLIRPLPTTDTLKVPVKIKASVRFTVIIGPNTPQGNIVDEPRIEDIFMSLRLEDN
jgi:hypothetical protein